MLQKMSESSGNIIGFQVSDHVTKEDYATLMPEVQALVDHEGSIGLLLDLEQFKWEDVSAWGADLNSARPIAIRSLSSRLSATNAGSI